MEIKLDLYDIWNTKKKDLAQIERNILFKEGEIWWCSLGLNIGTEIFGKGRDYRRPVLVIKKLSREDCIILPLTTIPKNGNWFVEIMINQEKRWVMLHQIRMVHIKRLESRIYTISGKDYSKVKKGLEQLLES